MGIGVRSLILQTGEGSSRQYRAAGRVEEIACRFTYRDGRGPGTIDGARDCGKGVDHDVPE
ncbi:hypothetical protein GCM10010166_14130 [Couchioplanes caeruleus subsp. azureus]|nr:hypothetical protein GCM10010166_14130 [Couchioplanes caeruleus subsp. azureus]